MRIAVILITTLVLLIILPIVLGGWLTQPESVSSSECIDCHQLDKIGILTTTGSPVLNEYEWQNQLHQALDNPDCLACHMIPGNELRLFQHELLKSLLRDKCALCHIDSVPDDALHASVGDACGTCHSTQLWSGALFEHDQFFRFDDRHPPICSNCHLVAGDFSQYSCYSGCHNEAEIRNLHLEEGIVSYDDCVQCH